MLSHDRTGEHPRGDAGQLILLAIFMAVWLYEERFLENLFGREYADYKARIPKWIPRLRAAPKTSGRAAE